MMNTLLTSVLIGTMCLFGTKLKVEDSTFKEIAPGVSTGYVVTQYEVQIKSNGNKKVSIDEVWLKNRQANWELIDAKMEKVEAINDKNTYTLKGQIKVRAAGAMAKSKPGTVETMGSFKEDFVVKYKVGSSSEVKLLTIVKIENLELVKMQ